MSPPEQKWMDFFANPNAFWDNRVGKRNPRAPDFKQKDGDAALWLDSRDTPPWVHSQVLLLSYTGCFCKGLFCTSFLPL